MHQDTAETGARYARIPRGQHGLTHELVSADQQARLHGAMVELVAEHGYASTTVEDVLSRAGISRRTFYELYTNRQQCFLAACDEVLDDWISRGAAAVRAAPDSTEPDRVRVALRAGLNALLSHVVSDPLGARTVLVETLNCGDAGLRRLERAIDDLEHAVLRAFKSPGGQVDLAPEMATVIVGGVLEIVTGRLRHERTGELAGLVEPLVGWMLSYRSSRAAVSIARAVETLAAGKRSAVHPSARDETLGEGEQGAGSLLWREGAVRPIAVQEPRARIVDAAARVASTQGYAALSANSISRAARVSHHTFRRYFKTKDEAFIATYRAGSKQTIEYCLKAFAGESTWHDSVRAGLVAELEFLSRRPELARIGFLEVYAAGPEGLELREGELHLFTTALEPGYQLAGQEPPSRVVSEAIAGGIYQMMRDCVLRDGPEQLPRLAAPAVFAALAPFLGADAAETVATAPPDA
jgi:AcrR family transcriptional regulator